MNKYFILFYLSQFGEFKVPMASKSKARALWEQPCQPAKNPVHPSFFLTDTILSILVVTNESLTYLTQTKFALTESCSKVLAQPVQWTGLLNLGQTMSPISRCDGLTCQLQDKLFSDKFLRKNKWKLHNEKYYVSLTAFHACRLYRSWIYWNFS